LCCVCFVGPRRIDAASFSFVRRASGVSVAVLDTGIDLNHFDLNSVDGTNCIYQGKQTHIKNTQIQICKYTNIQKYKNKSLVQTNI
jgi:hypothetical protein